MTLVISEVRSDEDMATFVEYPYDLYRGDVGWRPPLRLERREHISEKKNPIARTLMRQFFLARRGGQIAGRIGAFIHPVHQACHGDGAGHFGFFDCEDRAETGAALLQAAEQWLRAHDARKIIGPASHSINEECGLLIKGFEYPAVLMMGYGRPYYKKMIESQGFVKAVDMLALMADLHNNHPRSRATRALHKAAENNPSMTFRTIRPSHFREDVQIAMDIFNDAWADNWGFIPFSSDEVGHIATNLKPLIFRKGFRIGYFNEEPMAFVCMLPNLNEAIRDLDGRLWPLGWIKLVWRLKTKNICSGRIALMGVRRSYQQTKWGIAAAIKLCEDVVASGREQGFHHCEFSWILEDNKGMFSICQQAGAEHYKTYRMYEKNL